MVLGGFFSCQVKKPAFCCFAFWLYRRSGERDGGDTGPSKHLGFECVIGPPTTSASEPQKVIDKRSLSKVSRWSAHKESKVTIGNQGKQLVIEPLYAMSLVLHVFPKDNKV